jgi:predicted Zn-dependent protease
VRISLFLLLLIAVGQQPETMSLLKEPLYPPSVPRAERAKLEEQMTEARGDLGRDPSNADAVLRMARAQRGLGRVGDALETLTRAMESKVDTPAIRVERGNDFVVIRKFDVAQREFRKAAETIPEAHCGIAFALYLVADYKQAHEEYGKCPQPDVFGYLAAKRAGADPGPMPALPDETAARGAVTLPGSVARPSSRPEASMYASYVSAVDKLIAGDKAGARELLKPIVEKRKDDDWMEPIYIAAEADYVRVALPVKHKKKK